LLANSQENSVDFKEGFGMKNMRIRIEKLGGTISFESLAKEFTVSGNIPLK